MKNLSTHDKTYSDIPLSVIYNQIIRFMKENGIYAPYLEISLPQTNMSYERFLSHSKTRLDSFFVHIYNVGIDYEGYGKYEKNSRYTNSAVAFLNKTNNKWRSYLSDFIKAYKKWQNPQQI